MCPLWTQSKWSHHCPLGLPTPEIPMTPAHLTAGKNNSRTCGDNKYLFSFSPQLRHKPHPVPSNVPSWSSQKLVNIFGGKCQHHDVIWDLRFFFYHLGCTAVLCSNLPVLRTPACAFSVAEPTSLSEQVTGRTEVWVERIPFSRQLKV